MPEIPVFDQAAVLAAVSPLEAIERVRDGFVRHASGARGSEIVADLANNLPSPTDHGRSYSFRLRAGIR